MKNYKAYLAGGAIALLSAATLQASTLLGDRFVEVSAGYGFDQSDEGIDAWAVGVGVNLPVHASGAVHADLLIETGAAFPEEDVDADYQGTISSGIRFFMPGAEGSMFQPFFTLGIGYGRVEFDQGDSTDSFLWAVDAGVQIALSDRFALVPSVGYVDMTDFGSEQWGVDLEAIYGLTERLSLVADVSYSEAAGADDGVIGASAGVRFGF